MAKTTAKTTTTSFSATSAPKPAVEMPFGRMNYILLAAGAGVLALGFIIMSLDKEFVDATQFSMALHVSPIVVMAGFGLVAYAIMYRKK